MDNKQRALQMSAILVGFVLAVSACSGEKATESREARKTPPRVVIATARLPISATIYVARSRALFAAEGLDVQVVEKPTGDSALREVISGRADFATTAETPVVHTVLDGESIAVLATVATTRGALQIAARRDRSVLEPGDLAGTRVGATVGTIAPFFLDLFLTLHRVDTESVELVDTQAEGIVPAVTTGDLDAVVSWEPHTSRLRERHGNDIVFMTEPEIYSLYWNLVSTEEFARSHPAVCRALLRALLHANRWIVSNPEQAKSVVSSRLGLGDSTTEAMWSKTRFSIALDQALVLTMENQARWVLEKDNRFAEEVPDFLRVLAPTPLEDISPEAIGVPGIGELR